MYSSYWKSVISSCSEWMDTGKVMRSVTVSIARLNGMAKVASRAWQLFLLAAGPLRHPPSGVVHQSSILCCPRIIHLHKVCRVHSHRGTESRDEFSWEYKTQVPASSASGGAVPVLCPALLVLELTYLQRRPTQQESCLLRIVSKGRWCALET